MRLQQPFGMEGITSAALYMASSLTAVTQPSAPISLADRASSAIVVPAVADDLMQRRSDGVKSLADIIADEIRRADVERSSASSIVSTLIDDDATNENVSVNAAVLTSHDDRISFLKERISALKSSGAAGTPLLGGLRVRLHLAEAARQLALIRVDGKQDDAACTQQTVPASCQATRVSSVVPRAAELHAPHGSTSSTAEGSAARIFSAAAGLNRPRHGKSANARWRARVASEQRRFAAVDAMPNHANSVHVGNKFDPGHRRTRLTSTDRHDHHRGGATDGLERAHRLLASARRALESNDRAASHQEIHLAGLMHWQGSETWSLSDHRTVVT